jgi:3',5'-nucleoside bisphosphate phosphatase
MSDKFSSYVDLHCHSTASDGTLSPTDVVRLAKENNLSALSLTDHDTIGGLAEAADEAQRLGIDFLPGIEISCEYPHPGTMHLLGYGVDTNSPALQNLTRQLLEGRDNRNPKIIAKLQELGVSITMDEVENEAGGTVIGRPHIATILHRKGYVSSIKEAFNKYLAPGGLAYFDKERLSAKTAIQMILESGGLPVLAHPIQLRYENDAQLMRVVKDLIDLGLLGIEVIHSDHDEKLVSQYTQIADQYNLVKTGGSDFHGTNKKDIPLGSAKGRQVPRAFFDELVERHRTLVAGAAR